MNLASLTSNITRENAAHSPDTPYVYPLSFATLNGPIRNMFISFFFLTETNQSQTCSRVPQTSSLHGRNVQKSSGVLIGIAPQHYLGGVG